MLQAVDKVAAAAGLDVSQSAALNDKATGDLFAEVTK